MRLNKEPPGFSDYVSIVSLSILFGLSFTLTSISVVEIPPLSIAAARLLLAFLLLYPLMRLRGQRLPAISGIWFTLFASGFFGNAMPFALITWGQVNIDASLTAVFMAIMPLATILLAHVFTVDEKLDRWKFIGVIFGLIGVIVLMGISSLTVLGDDVVRQFAILCGALCYAVNAIITRKLTALPRWSAMTALMLTASIWVVPFSLFFDKPWQLQPSINAILAIIALAIGPTAIATVLILVIVGRQGASFLSQVNFMIPVFGMLFGSVLLHERLPANAYIALVIILTGIAISRLGTSNKLKKAKNNIK